MCCYRFLPLVAIKLLRWETSLQILGSLAALQLVFTTTILSPSGIYECCCLVPTIIKQISRCCHGYLILRAFAPRRGHVCLLDCSYRPLRYISENEPVGHFRLFPQIPCATIHQSLSLSYSFFY